MAMNGNQMADEVWAAIQAVGNGATQNDAKNRIKAMCNAIVNHIKNNGEISIDFMTANGSPVHNHLPASGEIS